MPVRYRYPPQVEPVHGFTCFVYSSSCAWTRCFPCAFVLQLRGRTASSTMVVPSTAGSLLTVSEKPSSPSQRLRSPLFAAIRRDDVLAMAGRCCHTASPCRRPPVRKRMQPWDLVASSVACVPQWQCACSNAPLKRVPTSSKQVRARAMMRLCLVSSVS